MKNAKQSRFLKEEDLDQLAMPFGGIFGRKKKAETMDSKMGPLRMKTQIKAKLSQIIDLMAQIGNIDSNLASQLAPAAKNVRSTMNTVAEGKTPVKIGVKMLRNLIREALEQSDED